MKYNVRIVPVKSENRESFAGLLFEPRPLSGEKYVAIGAIFGAEPCGTAVLSMMPGKVHIHSIYVDQKFRRRGVGRLLLDHVKDYAKKRECELISVNFMYSDEGMEEFFTSEDFFLTGEDAVFELSIREILERGKPDLLNNQTYKVKCRNFDTLDSVKLREVAGFLEDHEFPSEILKAPDFDEFLSCCAYDKQDKLQALLLCTSSPDRIMIEFLASRERIPKKLIGLLSYFYDVLKNGRNEDRLICFLEKRENTSELLKKLLDIHLEVTDFPVYGVYAVE